MKPLVRSFSPLSTIELKIPNCAAEDPSLLHLDRATTFGWRDYVNVVIKVFSLINQVNLICFVVKLGGYLVFLSHE